MVLVLGLRLHGWGRGGWEERVGWLMMTADYCYYYSRRVAPPCRAAVWLFNCMWLFPVGFSYTTLHTLM